METSKLNKNEIRWYEKAELLQEYIVTKGALPEDTTEYKGVKLGIWFIKQMRMYRKGNLSADRESVLRSIGIEFNSFTQEEHWLNNYELLKEYISIEGFFPNKKIEYNVYRKRQKRWRYRSNISMVSLLFNSLLRM